MTASTTSGGPGDLGTGHVSDDLPLLLAGEADRATVREVGVHLRACTDCRDDLVEAVLAHATLRSAARTAPDVATGGRLPYLVPDLPARIDEVVDRTPERQPVDLGPVFAQIRAEAAGAADESSVAPSAPSASTAPVDELAARRGRRVRRGLVAAAAVVVLGGGTAAVVATQSQPGRAVTVSAYGAGTVGASARVGNDWMTLDASSLQKPSPNKFYEAWLVNADTTGFLPLGPLGTDGKATFSVPEGVMAQYPTLQVTLQDNNGDPRPSATSVLRASL